MMNGTNAEYEPRRANLRVAFMAGAIVLGMGCLTWASVPLYRIFCQVTGYGGTTQVADAVNDFDLPILDREMSVRFNTDIAPDLPWDFKAEQLSVKVQVGAQALVYFKVANKTDQPITGRAVYNVTPNKAGLYFSKIECFCFTEQTLQPGQVVDMPVQFFIDPQIAEDPLLDDVKEVTLSYTFFRSEG